MLTHLHAEHEQHNQLPYEALIKYTNRHRRTTTTQHTKRN